MPDSLENLNRELKQFALDRNWVEFHNPKNLAMALSVEAAELMEHFQWLTPEQALNPGKSKLDEIALEIADIQIYLIRISEVLGINIIKSTEEKIKINHKRFLPEKNKNQPNKGAKR